MSTNTPLQIYQPATGSWTPEQWGTPFLPARHKSMEIVLSRRRLLLASVRCRVLRRNVFLMSLKTSETSTSTAKSNFLSSSFVESSQLERALSSKPSAKFHFLEKMESVLGLPRCKSSASRMCRLMPSSTDRKATAFVSTNPDQSLLKSKSVLLARRRVLSQPTSSLFQTVGGLNSYLPLSIKLQRRWAYRRVSSRATL